MMCRVIPYEGNSPFVFVSFSQDDCNVVYPLMEQMTADGYRVWYNENSNYDEKCMDTLEDHLLRAQVFITFVSGGAAFSHTCRSEIIYALKSKKKIIPIRIDSKDIPLGYKVQISHFQCLNLSATMSTQEMLSSLYRHEEVISCKSASGKIKMRAAQAEKVADAPKKRIKLFSTFGQSRFYDSPSVKPEEEKKKVASDLIVSENEEAPEPLTVLKTDDALHDSFTIDEGDITVYETASGDETVVESLTLTSDGDKTVRESSRHTALLLYPAENKVYTLRKPQTKIGRSPIKCDVVLEGNNSISKYHADIIQYNNKCYLRDANSANGTFVNGKQIESGEQVPLDNPAIFKLNDEILILITGIMARKLMSTKVIAYLTNDESTSVRILDVDTFPLNRNHKWPDGTLSDSKIHRAAHAKVCLQEGAFYLVDESPEGGNGTRHNGRRLKRGESQILSSGDQIRLGDTVLEFGSIEK